MRWQWKLGRFAGIDVYIHATFLLILAFVAWTHGSGGLPGILEGLLFILAIFTCVVLHEYGHALTARTYGIATRDITLYPIGGVARLERMPDKPIQDLWVALAGPAVNVVLAIALFAWLVISQTLRPLAELTFATGPFLERLMGANLFLALFNLIPAFPMDGGRVLRALLAMRLEYTRATAIAAGIGQGLALVFGLAGLFGNPMLLFIAFFVWIGAGQEASLVQMRSALAGIPVSRVMITDFKTLSVDDPLSRAVDLILQGSQQDFPVLREGHPVGVLVRSDLLAALQRQEPDTTVGSIMRTEHPTAETGELLEPLFLRLRENDCHIAPVVRDGILVGLVTTENVGEFLMIQSAMGKRQPHLVPES